MDAELDSTKENLERIIEHLCARLPDPRKAVTALRKFAEVNPARIYTVLRKIMDEQVEFKDVLKSIVILHLNLERN